MLRRIRGKELPRRQQHHHLASFEARLRFDLGNRCGVDFHAVEQFIAKLLVRHFATAEAQGDLDLIALFEEALHRAHFHVVIVVVDHRPELDLLDLDDFLFFAGFRRLLLRLELVLAVIQDLGDGRNGVGGDLDEIKPGRLGKTNGGFGGDDAFVVTGIIDQLNLAGADLLVDARAVLLGGLDRKSVV